MLRLLLLRQVLNYNISIYSVCNLDCIFTRNYTIIACCLHFSLCAIITCLDLVQLTNSADMRFYRYAFVIYIEIVNENNLNRDFLLLFLKTETTKMIFYI